MTGEKLHKFDRQFCHYALDNVCSHLDRPAFAHYVEKQLEPCLWTYLQALDEDETPELLLGDKEFEELALAFEEAPLEFGRKREPYEAPHCRSIECFSEIRDALAPMYAVEWAQTSARIADRLENKRTRLNEGILIVHDWEYEARRLLRAMGATALLPHPAGTFPTPMNPDPPVFLASEEGQPGSQVDGSLIGKIAAIQALQHEVRDLLLTERTLKDFYTTAEVASMGMYVMSVLHT